MQHALFKKFLKEEFRFVVFNDANIPENEKKINDMCVALGVECIRIPQKIHTLPYMQRINGENWNHPSVRNSNVVQYSMDNYGFNHDDILVLLDSDLFLVNEFSIRDYLRDYDMAGCLHSRGKGSSFVDYLWIGLIFIDMKKVRNIRTICFNTGRINDIPVDAGGYTHYFLKNNPENKIRHFGSCPISEFFCNMCKKNNKSYCTHNTELLINDGFNGIEIEFIQSGITNSEFFIGNSFFHYRGGSNWDNQSASYHAKKQEKLEKFVEAKIGQ